mgnify:FL=1|jgi:hypothetical protein
MILNLNKTVIFFFSICFISMAVPYFFDLGEGSVFKNDFYAKRIMTITSFPFFVWISYLVFRKNKLSFNIYIVVFLLVYLVILLTSFIKGNKLSLIIIDAFIALLPVFFYLLVFKTSLTIDSYKKCFLWLISLSSLLVLFNIKLQFSYFTLISLSFLLFFVKWEFKNILLFILIPVLAYKSLIGKSALLMLTFIIAYFFIFETKTISRRKKLYLLLIPSVLLTFVVIIFWSKIQETGSYQNMVYFLRHADFTNFSFEDKSTSHRLYEAKIIMSNFNNSNFFIKFFGNGFGSTIDLSGTLDATIAASNADTSNVRNIHMGFFAVLSRYGILGCLMYVGFIFRMLFVCYKVLKKGPHYSLTLGCLYILILLFDSLISFPHMMSNFLFWYITYIVFLEYKKGKFILIEN